MRGTAADLFPERGGALVESPGGEGAGPPDPAGLQFSMKRGEARRDSAGIRLHIEAVPDSPNGDRKTVRDEDEGHVRKEPLIDPVAGWTRPDGGPGVCVGGGSGGGGEGTMRTEYAAT